ncbi:MAG: DUF1080 domain-containing protein [Chthoniobacter sp.]|nr:DUF1080 domain-containing protein [Chthoniobacter sp.]
MSFRLFLPCLLRGIRFFHLKNAAVLLAVLGLGLAADRALAVPNDVSAEEKAAGFESLFDGTSLAAWRGYKRTDVPAGWQALDGSIVLVGPGSDLVTVKTYRSFDFRFEWKIAPGENSGVLYGVNEARREAHESGPEYQVVDNGKDGATTVNSAGGNFALHAPLKDVVKPPGQWNEGRIVVDGTHVEHWLNGEKVVAYEIRSPEWVTLVAQTKFKDKPDYGKVVDGHIALQNHGGPRWWAARLAGISKDDAAAIQEKVAVVWFRNLRIRALPEKAPK